MSRRLKNQGEVESLLYRYGFEEVFAEDQTVFETAKMFSEAEAIISVHGSGLSNLSFASPGVKVVDLLPPAHLDPYYWIITEQIGGTYSYIFGDGDRPPEHLDLVQDKVDPNIHIDVNRLTKMFDSIDIHPLCLLYTSPSPRDRQKSRMPSSA